MEASVILCKCGKCNRVYGIRIQKMEDGDWWRTWAFKISAKSAKNEGFDRTQIRGNLNETSEYPGCPYCGTYGFVQCSVCHKLSCWNNESEMLCPWCGTSMSNIKVATEKFNV